MKKEHQTASGEKTNTGSFWKSNSSISSGYNGDELFFVFIVVMDINYSDPMFEDKSAISAATSIVRYEFFVGFRI
jgi:hypothetical protein